MSELRDVTRPNGGIVKNAGKQGRDAIGGMAMPHRESRRRAPVREGTAAAKARSTGTTSKPLVHERAMREAIAQNLPIPFGRKRRRGP
jgi:hypothetical protein